MHAEHVSESAWCVVIISLMIIKCIDKVSHVRHMYLFPGACVSSIICDCSVAYTTINLQCPLDSRHSSYLNHRIRSKPGLGQTAWHRYSRCVSPTVSVSQWDGLQLAADMESCRLSQDQTQKMQTAEEVIFNRSTSESNKVDEKQKSFDLLGLLAWLVSDEAIHSHQDVFLYSSIIWHRLKGLPQRNSLSPKWPGCGQYNERQ